MKKLIFYLTASAIGLGLAWVALWQVNEYQLRKLDASSTEFVRIASEQILSNWDTELLIANSADSLLKAMPRNGMAKYMSSLQVLGEFQQIDSIAGQSVKRSMFDRSSPIVANYVLKVPFKNGMATVYETLLLEHDVWKFTQFSVINSLTIE